MEPAIEVEAFETEMHQIDNRVGGVASNHLGQGWQILQAGNLKEGATI